MVTFFCCIALLARAENPPQSVQAASMADMLAARTTMVNSLTAEVRQFTEPGSQLRELADRMEQVAGVMTARFPERANEAKDLADRAGNARRYGSTRYCSLFRVAIKSPAMMRIESFGRVDEGGTYESEPRLLLYRDGAWTVYRPPSRSVAHSGRLPDSGSILVLKENQTPVQPRVVTALAVPVERFFGEVFNLSQEAVRTGAVSWSELMNLTSAQPKQMAMKGLAGLPKPLPALSFTSRSLPKGSLPLYRFTVCFDPAEGYQPVAYEAEDLVTGISNSEPYYRTVARLRWSGYRETRGAWLPNRCQAEGFQHFIEAPTDAPMAEWRLTTYAATQVRTELSHLSVNEGVGDDRFAFAPPPGASVADQEKGVKYVVGSAGEALNKTAIAALDQFGDPVRPTSWLWYGLAGAAVLLAALGLLWRRRVQRRAIA